MTNVTPSDFPDINLAFEQAYSTEEICVNHIGNLRATSHIRNIMCANKLEEFIEADKHIPHLEKEFKAFKKFLRRWANKHNAKIILKMRKKSFFGFLAKIYLFLKNGDDVNLIRDLLGFKLILCYDGDEEDIIRLCYKLANDVLIFFASERHCDLIDAEKCICLDSCMELIPELKKKVKDYIVLTKEDGYRALHLFVRTRLGLTFEIQILTLDMSIHADETHEVHKKNRYADMQIPFDYKKIKLANVKFDKNGTLLRDFAGLFESLNILDKI